MTLHEEQMLRDMETTRRLNAPAAPQATRRASAFWPFANMAGSVIMLVAGLVTGAWFHDYAAGAYCLVLSEILNRNASESAKEAGLE